MKTKQRYLLAKYVPDTRRNEPVNVGVVLWCNGRTASKFLPMNLASELVKDAGNYERWINYWQKLLAADSIEPLRGSPIPRKSPEFLDEFIRTQKDSYQLVEAGEIIDKVMARDIERATNYLFGELVERTPPQSKSVRERGLRLYKACSQVFDAAGLSERKDFRHGYSAMCQVGRLSKPLKFNYAVADGEDGIRAAFQRVNLSAPQTVNNAYFTFERLKDSLGKLGQSPTCATLVQLDDIEGIPDAQLSIEMLKDCSEVVDVSRYDEAVDKLSALMQAA